MRLVNLLPTDFTKLVGKKRTKESRSLTRMTSCPPQTAEYPALKLPSDPYGASRSSLKTGRFSPATLDVNRIPNVAI